MFTSLHGKSDLTLDERGRVAFPTRCQKKVKELCAAKQREASEDPDLSRKFWVTVGPEDSVKPLYIYPHLNWQGVEAALTQCDRTKPNVEDAVWRMMSHAEEGALDRSGRLLIPQTLRDQAGLKKKVVLLGVMYRFELWDHTFYRERLARGAKALNLDGLGAVPL